MKRDAVDWEEEISEVNFSAPTILVLVGGMLVAGGTFWSGYRQANLNSILRSKNDEIIRLQSESIKYLTGGDSFPYVIPQTHAPADDGSLPLIVHNSGDYPLIGVKLNIRTAKSYSGRSKDFFDGATQDIGNIAPHGFAEIKEFINPIPDSDGVATYIIDIWAQNGYFTQSLLFRKGKYELPWAFQYSVQSNPLTPNIGDSGYQSKILKSQAEWSDDMGDGKPALK